MLTRLAVRNFKRLDEVEIELGSTVVLIGPNNSGKTAALQALALWAAGLRRWNEARGDGRGPEKRPGVAINRRDLVALPVPQASLLWHDLRLRDVSGRDGKSGGMRRIQSNVLIQIVVEGITSGEPWACGLEFDYANPEFFYCRPLRQGAGRAAVMPIPPDASAVEVVFLPPMSGLAAVEPRVEPGRISVLIGEGQTAQVLRNVCWQVLQTPDGEARWESLAGTLDRLFGARLDPPRYVQERGEITMTYQERGISLDITSAGRGLQQTLLLLAHLHANPGTVMLLDEPDAHLEILRQRQIYQVMTDVASRHGSQIIAASHSEVVLNEAAERDVLIAFVGKPHRIDDRGSQVLKALRDIGFEDYYQAETKGWVLYLEGSTDLAILQAFAKTLGHEARGFLADPFVKYVGNDAQAVNRHFWGLREAKPDLAGIALFDRLERGLPAMEGIVALEWSRREIENYLCQEQVLVAYARGEQTAADLFSASEAQSRQEAMEQAISQVNAALRTLRRLDGWSEDIKASDEFLDPLFEAYFSALELPNQMRKTNYHVLAALVPKEAIAPEVTEKLDAIVNTARAARPRQ